MSQKQTDITKPTAIVLNEVKSSDNKETHPMIAPCMDTRQRILMARYTVAGGLILLGLFMMSRYNFLLFHTIAELFSIAAAWSVFFLVWNTKKIVQNDALLFLGIAYLFVGVIDLTHTLSYKGMGVFPSPLEANYATQLWIAARSMEATSLLLFPLLIMRRIRLWTVLTVYTGITAVVMALIFLWHLFPDCYIEGQGLTVFKKSAEYLISLILAGAIAFLFKMRNHLEKTVFLLMIGAMVVTIVSELAFTFYVSVYGLSNVIGHFLKIISFFLVYMALVRSSLLRPYTTLFRNLEKEKAALKESKKSAIQEILKPKGDIGSLSLGDIIDKETLQSLMEEFYKLTHILSGVLDHSGNILVAVGWQDICTKFHRCHPDTSKNCFESDTLLSSGVPAGTFKAYRCKNNMWDMVTPIEVGGQHLGNIFIGQFFYKDDEPDYDLFRSQAQKYGFDEKKYLAALDRVPRLSKETVDAAMTFFSKLAEMISSLSFSNINLSRTLSQQKSVLRKLGESEAKLNQAQKMESVGRLAGGVAHDFNNMLGVILGHTEIIMDQMDSSQPFFNSLQEIKTAAQRSADLTRQLLAFARKQTISPKVLDMNKTVESMLMMLRRLIGEDIDLAWLPGKKLWMINIDPSQVDQILANLCVNARDAIVDTGKLTIETGTVGFDEMYCAEHQGFQPGKYVLLAVSDNGCGMDTETQNNIFDPFFTTKEFGKGTGLGLATVYGIVKQNKGFINVYSEPDQGTTFKIYLPRHMDKTEAVPKEKAAEPSVHGNETILLVEDEPAILELTTMMLQRLGYTVLPASSPGEAIRQARDHLCKIDLLITDVVMPEMNGRDLAKNLLSLYPNLKCLFMSGYTANVIAQHGVLDKGMHFIQKPFSKKDLANIVKKVLEESASPELKTQGLAKHLVSPAD